MKKIGQILGGESKFKRLAKPLQAASVCEVARRELGARARIISYCEGSLAVSVHSNFEASNLQMQSSEIISKINNSLGNKLVKRLRFKIDQD